MLDLAAIRHTARRYRLLLPDLQSRRASGDLLGRGTGGSVEYQDHRQYYLGDDVRHIDWGAFARSDRLSLKMYREEVSPVVDVVVDASESCGADEAKKALLLELALALQAMCARHHAHTRLWVSGGMVRAVERPDDIVALAFARELSLAHALRDSEVPRRRSIKVVLSDFLYEGDPRDLVGLLAPRTDRLVLIQVLSAFEASPSALGGTRLLDADTGGQLDLVVDDSAARRYRQRLAQLQGAYADQARAANGAFVSLAAGLDLDAALSLLVRERVTTVV